MSNKLHQTKPFSSLEDQVDLLKDRGLIIHDKEMAKKHLLEKNYFDLINGFETLMLIDSKSVNKKYSHYYFEDFLFLYKFDKELTSLILKSLDKFETKLKTSMAYRFCEKHFNSPLEARSYVDVSKYTNPQDRNHYLSLSNDVRFNIRTHKIFKNYSRNSQSRKDYIDYSKEKYTFLSTYDDPPFWMTIKVMEFGFLFKLLIAFEKDIFEKVMNDLGMNFATDKETFVTSIRIFIELRNTCAHFQLANRFRTPNNIKIGQNMIKDLNLQTKVNIHGKPTQFELKLFDTLLVLNQFENMSEVQKLIREYYNKCNSKRQRDLFGKILNRMGRNKVSNWKF